MTVTISDCFALLGVWLFLIRVHGSMLGHKYNTPYQTASAGPLHRSLLFHIWLADGVMSWLNVAQSVRALICWLFAYSLNPDWSIGDHIDSFCPITNNWLAGVSKMSPALSVRALELVTRSYSLDPHWSMGWPCLSWFAPYPITDSLMAVNCNN
jgi:hypothetical protein